MIEFIIGFIIGGLENRWYYLSIFVVIMFVIFLLGMFFSKPEPPSQVPI